LETQATQHGFFKKFKKLIFWKKRKERRKKESSKEAVEPNLERETSTIDV
jgi:hypothetical protein